MKTRPTLRTLALWALLLSTFTTFYVAQLSTCLAQGTAFTYQGRLNDGGNPGNGSYDMSFALFQYPSGGSAVLGPITNLAVTVSNGLFTTLLDFGPYSTETYSRGRWLEISVRTNGAAPLTVLDPRQPLTPAPSAIYAAYAGAPPPGVGFHFTGPAVFDPPVGPPFTVSNTNQVANLNVDLLDGLDSSAFWKIGGNAGTTAGTHFLGTTDNQALEFKVNNQRGLRIEYGSNASYGISPNVIGGISGNTVVYSDVVGATIAGGGGPFTRYNRVMASFATVGGGLQNWADGFSSTVGGGGTNLASGSYSTVGGGGYNYASGVCATIPGGVFNTASSYAFAAGRRAKANHTGAFVWADSQNADFSSTADNQFLIRAAGGVGINTPNPGAMLQVGDQNLAGSQGMMRFGSHSSTGPENRYWDIGVPKGDADISGKNYAFVIDDPQLGTEPEVVVRWDTGNVGIGLTNPGSKLHVNGTVTATAFNPPSDRNLKENFATVNPREVLDKVAGLAISRWNFKGDTATPHVGPMAQDFHAAFGLGTDERHIATVDADGVALAAIQGLNQKVTEELKQKETEIAELKQRLDQLEKFMSQRTRGAK